MNAFHDNASEFDRWQSIEREVWGDGEVLEDETLSKKEKRAQKKHRDVAVAAEDRSGGPLLIAFFFGLGFFGLMYWVLVLRAPADTATVAKTGAPVAARVVDEAQPTTCAPLIVLLGNERFMATEGEVADYVAASEADIAAIADLKAANADVAKLASPLEFRAQIALVAARQVGEGSITLADLRNQVAPLDPQISGAMAALAASQRENCG